MNKRKVYVVGGDTSYANWLNAVVVPNMEDADIVLFTGGEDVCPTLYNEPIGSRTHYNPARDIREKEAFIKALDLGKHMLGICRGSQLLCVLSGGRLVQHQENPNPYHSILLAGKYSNKYSHFLISSTHHQAQYPYDMPEKYYTLIAYANESRYHLDGKDKEMFAGAMGEAEIVRYPITKCLGIQGHPEFMSRAKYGATFEVLDSILEDFLNDK